VTGREPGIRAINYQLADRRIAAAGFEPGPTEPDAVFDRDRQRVLAKFGLPAALRGYVARLERDGSGGLPAIALDLDEQAAELPQPLALALFRIVQEAVRNSVRHARAHQITVRLRRESAWVRLQVQDDGRGVRVPARLNRLAQAGHFGLVGLAERVEQADGEFTVASAPGAGTTIAVRLPIVDEGDERADSGAAGR
jgi:signal transduction histidine kinase